MLQSTPDQNSQKLYGGGVDILHRGAFSVWQSGFFLMGRGASGLCIAHSEGLYNIGYIKLLT